MTTSDICDVYLRHAMCYLARTMAAYFDMSLQSLNRLVASEESYREVKELYQRQNGRDEERPAG